MNLTSANSAATPGVKPGDRDEHSSESNEPEVIPLDVDYSDPDDTIASIIRGDFEPEVNRVCALGTTTAQISLRIGRRGRSRKVRIENELVKQGQG